MRNHFYTRDEGPSPEQQLAWLKAHNPPLIWMFEREIAAQEAFVAWRAAIASGANPDETHIEDLYQERSEGEQQELNRVMTLVYRHARRRGEDISSREKTSLSADQFFDFWKHITPEMAHSVSLELLSVPPVDTPKKELSDEARLLLLLCRDVIYGMGHAGKRTPLPPAAKERHLILGFEVGPDQDTLFTSDAELFTSLELAQFVLGLVHTHEPNHLFL